MVPRIALALALMLGAPAVARAVTIDDIVALAKSGVSADILIAVIDADQTMFTLTREDILALNNAGVPSAVVVKMLGTPQEFAVEVPPPLIVGNTPAPAPEPAATITFPTYYGYGWPFFVHPGRPVKTPVVPPMRRHDFGRFINDGWIEGRGFGRFINTP